MAYRVLLDANVLFPFSLRDTLLRLAEIELYDCLWSDRILDEMTSNLVRTGKMRPEQTLTLCEVMNGAFEDAAVDWRAIELLEPSMPNAEEDRHVLAAAVAGKANGIVTNNVRHFDAQACEPFGITVTTADDFLCVLFDMNPAMVVQAVRDQAADLRNPPKTFEDILELLERGGSIEFVRKVREFHAESGA